MRLKKGYKGLGSLEHIATSVIALGMILSALQESIPSMIYLGLLACIRMILLVNQREKVMRGWKLTLDRWSEAIENKSPNKRKK